LLLLGLLLQHHLGMRRISTAAAVRGRVTGI
jgi:hypothetical protein